MADWPNITDAQCDPDAPVTSELIYGLRDAPIAIAEGADGAPRIRPMALGVIAAGSVLRSTNPGTINASATDIVLDFFMAQKGSVRLSLEHQSTASPPGSTVVSVVNKLGASTSVATWTNTGTYVLRTVDVPFSCGDTIRITVQFTNAGGGGAGLRNISLSTNGGYIWPTNFGIIWP